MNNLFFRNPRLLILAVCLILVMGLSSYTLLPRMEDPLLVPRGAHIKVIYPGADAERVESLVTEKVEDALSEINEIKELRSRSRTGVMTLDIELRNDVTRAASGAIWARIRDKIDDAADEFPDGASEPTFDEAKIKAYTNISTLTWNKSTPPNYSIMRRLALQFEDKIKALNGTEEVEIVGDPKEEIVVTLDPELMTSMGLTAQSVSDQILASDSKISAGQLRQNGSQIPLEVAGEMDSLRRVSSTPINFADGSFVHLSDIATVSKGTRNPPEALAIIDGKPAVAVCVFVRSDARVDHWAKGFAEIESEFASTLPDGIQLEVIFNQNDYVETRLESLLLNLFLGASAVVIVIFFMMGWRSAILVGSSLPLSSLMVIAGMRLMDIPIHQMSITGLIIALGLLIDNAIVVVDEVSQSLRAGHSPAEAVAKTVSHLAIPLLGSTLTTAFAFGPIALMPGPAGEIVGSIAISVIMAIFSSLFLAMTLVPAFAAMGIRPNSEQRSFFNDGWFNDRLTDYYRKTLNWFFKRPALGLLVGAVLPLIGFFHSQFLDEQFFPPADRDQIHIELELSPTATLEDTVKMAHQMRSLALENERVKNVHWFVGESAPTFYYNLFPNRKNQSRYAQAIVQIDSATKSRELIHELQAKMNREFPEALTIVRQLEQGPPFYAPIELKLFGPNVDRLVELGNDLRLVLSETEEVVHTRSEMGVSIPKISFVVDEDAARLTGLNNTQVAQQLFATLEGKSGGSILESTEELPIRVRVGNVQRSDLNAINSLDLMSTVAADQTLSSLNYRGIPLSSIAKVRLDSEITGVNRFNSRRMNEVQAFINAGVLPANVLAEFEERLAQSEFELPPGYSIEYGGEYAKRNEAVGDLAANTGVLIVLMISTLVLSFRSFRIAGLIGIVAVLSVGLGLGGLWLFGYPFGFMAIVGTMGLIGVAINDTIVVLAEIQSNEQAKMGDSKAISDVVVKSSRHIFATSLTTIAGFTPLVLAGGGFWPPMAGAVAGGVGGATILALYFVPAAYILSMCGAKRKSENDSVPTPQTQPVILDGTVEPNFS